MINSGTKYYKCVNTTKKNKAWGWFVHKINGVNNDGACIRRAHGPGRMYWVVWGLFGLLFGRNDHRGNVSEVNTCEMLTQCVFKRLDQMFERPPASFFTKI